MGMNPLSPSTADTVNPPPGRPGFARAGWCGVTLALLWAALNPGDPKSWLVGIPVVVFATVVSLRLQSPVPRRFSLPGALRFAVFFIHQSFRGGWDVAKRALSPAMPLNPALLTYRLRLRDEPAQVLLVNVISLLPGTVSAGLENGVVTLHALDGGPATLAETKALEDRIAALFSLELKEESDE